MKKRLSTALVRRLVDEISDEIRPDEQVVRRFAEVKNLPEQVVRNRIVRSAVRRALHLTGGDENRAKTALTIVNGRQPRLPQCVKLLTRHREETVALAYEARGDCAVSSVSLSNLCRMLEHTDEDIDGEAGALIVALDEIAIRADSKRKEWFFHQLIVRRLRDGQMMEAISDEVSKINGDFNPRDYGLVSTVEEDVE